MVYFGIDWDRYHYFSNFNQFAKSCYKTLQHFVIASKTSVSEVFAWQSITFPITCVGVCSKQQRDISAFSNPQYDNT
ncbi:hypothetical protein [Helicobacter sp. T3_23-1056]